MKRSILFSVVIGMVCSMPLQLCAMNYEKLGDDVAIDVSESASQAVRNSSSDNESGEESSGHECSEAYCCDFRCQCTDIDHDKNYLCKCGGGGYGEFIGCDVDCDPCPTLDKDYCEHSAVCCQKKCKFMVRNRALYRGLGMVSLVLGGLFGIVFIVELS